MIIDATDFTNRPNKVPNQEESRDFISFIEAEEEAFACWHHEEHFQLLGKELWEEFKAALAGSGTLETKWQNLKDGAEYTYQGKTYRYGGWVDMIRPGIYARWIPNIPYKLTNIGYVENSAPEKSKLLEDQYPFVVQEWNKFVDKVGHAHQYGYNYRNSFYGFMKANASDYPSWVFKCPHLKNRHDL